MNEVESLEAFYERTHISQKGIFTCNNGHINVYNREHCKGKTPYRRRDFYKISLINEAGIVHYADKSIELNRPALVFSNPMIPYSWKPLQERQTGYFCVFTEEFMQQYDRDHLLTDASVFKPGGKPVFFITKEQQLFFDSLFLRMAAEIDSEYSHKEDLLYNYIRIFIHEARKMEPADNYFHQQNAASRIAELFMELLERQFPIERPNQALQLKTAADYATQLSIHVNYLNRAVKENTGITTSGHIAERVVNEAKILLSHTNWNVSEIAYALGFEYPSYFNNFFKRHASTTPRAFRNEDVYMRMDN